MCIVFFNVMLQKDIFISHTWRFDEEGRSTHERARSLTRALQRLGWSIWFDEDDMSAGNMDYAMSSGIENAQVVLICVTKRYIEKVNYGLSKPVHRDNCATEWSCAMIRQKFVLPLVFEPCMLDTSEWPYGPVATHLGSHRYINASDDDWRRIAAEVSCTLGKEGLFPRGKKPILSAKKSYVVSPQMTIRCSETNLPYTQRGCSLLRRRYRRTPRPLLPTSVYM